MQGAGVAVRALINSPMGQRFASEGLKRYATKKAAEAAARRIMGPRGKGSEPIADIQKRVQARIDAANKRLTESPVANKPKSDDEFLRKLQEAAQLRKAKKIPLEAANENPSFYNLKEPAISRYDQAVSKQKVLKNAKKFEKRLKEIDPNFEMGDLVDAAFKMQEKTRAYELSKPKIDMHGLASSDRARDILSENDSLFNHWLMEDPDLMIGQPEKDFPANDNTPKKAKGGRVRKRQARKKASLKQPSVKVRRRKPKTWNY